MTLQAAITARAWRTPLGSDIDAVVDRLYAGERAATVNFPAAPLEDVPGAPTRCEPSRSRHRRFLRRIGLLAVDAGREAFEASQASSGERLGVFAAVGGLLANWDELMPAMAKQTDGRHAWAGGLGRLHPFWLLQYLSNNVQALLAADIGARGDGIVFGGPTAGAHAIGAATAALAEHSIDAAIVVAYDGLLEPQRLVDLVARGECARGSLDGLRAPYDDDACGYVPGEAAAAVVLERPADARRCLALVSSVDVADASSGQPGAELLGRLVRDIDATATLIDGAARSSGKLDAAERAALSTRFNQDTPLTAISSSLGELAAAKPVVQAIALSEFIRRGAAPPIAGSRRSAAGPLRPLTSTLTTDLACAVGITTGAPGHAAAVTVSRARVRKDR